MLASWLPITGGFLVLLLSLHFWVRVKPLQCPNGHGRMHSNRINDMISRVYHCDICEYSTAPYLTSSDALLTRFETIFNLFTFRWIDWRLHYYQYNDAMLRAFPRLKASLPIFHAPLDLISKLGAYQLSLASQLFSMRTGYFLPRFTFEISERTKHMRKCSRCGTAILPISRDNPKEFQWMLGRYIFCTENCKIVFAFENTCQKDGCGKMLLYPKWRTGYKGKMIPFCSKDHMDEWRVAKGFQEKVPTLVLERRNTMKKIGLGVAGLVAATFFLGDYIGKSEAAINPVASMTANYSQYGAVSEAATVITFLDTNGNGYLKSGDDGSICMLANVITSAGQTNGAGTSGNSSTTNGIAESFAMVGAMTNPSAPFGRISSRRGSYTFTSTPTFPVNAQGLEWVGEAGGAAQGGGAAVILQAGSTLTNVITWGGASAAQFRCTWRNLSFSSNSHTMSSGTMCDCSYTSTASKQNEFYNCSFSGAAIAVDTSEQDGTNFWHCNTPAGGGSRQSVWNHVSSSGTSAWFGGSLFGGMNLALQQAMFYSTVFTNAIIFVAGGASWQQFNFYGGYQNSPSDGSNFQSSTTNTSNVYLAGFHMGNSGAGSQSIWFNGTNAHNFIVINLNGSLNNLSGGTLSYFAGGDSTSKAYNQNVTIQGGTTSFHSNNYTAGQVIGTVANTP